LWLLFLVACLASFTLNQDNKKPKQLQSAILKQLLNYMQMMEVALMVTEYRGPGKGFRSFLSTMQSVTGVNAMNFSNLSGWCFARMVAPNLAIYKAVTLVGLLWVPFVVAGNHDNFLPDSLLLPTLRKTSAETLPQGIHGHDTLPLFDKDNLDVSDAFPMLQCGQAKTPP